MPEIGVHNDFSVSYRLHRTYERNRRFFYTFFGLTELSTQKGCKSSLDPFLNICIYSSLEFCALFSPTPRYHNLNFVIFVLFH